MEATDLLSVVAESLSFESKLLSVDGFPKNFRSMLEDAFITLTADSTILDTSG